MVFNVLLFFLLIKNLCEPLCLRGRYLNGYKIDLIDNTKAGGWV